MEGKNMSLGYEIFRICFVKGFSKSAYKADSKRLSTLILPKEIDEYKKEEGTIRFLIHRKKNLSSYLGILFDIHGGGWVYGDKELNRPFNMTMAEKGFLVISMDYRLVDKVHVQDQVKDIVDIMNYVYQNKEELNIDFNLPVFLTGDSAGAMLSGIVYVLSVDKELKSLFQLEVPFSFKKIVLNHPACYTSSFSEIFHIPIFKKRIDSLFSRLLYGKGYKTDKICIYTQDLSSLAKRVSFPSTLIVTSIGDKEFYPFALKAYKDLKEENVDVKIYVNEKEPNSHVFNVAFINDESAIETNEMISNFLIEDDLK